MKKTLPRYFLLSAPFLMGVLLGRLCWTRIKLPFHNPWHVMGTLAEIQYNPTNDLLRFLIFISLPVFFIFAAFLMNIKKVNDACFTRAIKAPDMNIEAEIASPSKRIGIILFIICIVVLALNTPTFHAWSALDTYHEGESLGASISYINGEAPYKDFLFLHGIYQDPLRSVVAFKMFGKSIGAVRTLESLTKIMVFVLLAVFILLAYRGNLTYSYISVFILLGFLYQTPPFNETLFGFWRKTALLRVADSVVMSLFIKLRDITTIAFLVTIPLLQNFVRNNGGNIKYFCLTSFFFSFIPLATFAYSVERGVYLFVAFLVLAPIYYIFRLDESRQKRYYMIFLLFGLSSACLLLFSLLHDGFTDFLSFTFLIMPRYEELMDGTVYPIERLPFLTICLLIAANIYWVTLRFLQILHANDRKIREGNKEFAEKYFTEFSLLILSVFIFRNALTHSDLHHTMYSSWMTYLLAVYILTKHYLHPILLKHDPNRFLFYPLALIVGITLSIGIYRIESRDLAVKNFPLSVPDSDLIPDNYKAAIRFIKENLKEDEEFLTLNSDPMWYYFVNKPCPIRFPILRFASPDFYQREVVDDLKQGNVKLVLYKNDHWANNFKDLDTAARLPQVIDYIHESYIFFTKIDDNEIWIRKAE